MRAFQHVPAKPRQIRLERLAARLPEPDHRWRGAERQPREPLAWRRRDGGWRALRHHFNTGKTRYARYLPLGRRRGAGVGPHVRAWHFSDVIWCAENVRSSGVERTSWLRAPTSAKDPLRKSQRRLRLNHENGPFLLLAVIMAIGLPRPASPSALE